MVVDEDGDLWGILLDVLVGLVLSEEFVLVDDFGGGGVVEEDVGGEREVLCDFIVG